MNCKYGTPCSNAFAMKLAPSGALVWATYLGGSGGDDAHAIAVDRSGNVWIVGETVSPNFPVTPGAFDSSFGGEVDFGPLQYGDAFVSKLDPTGSSCSIRLTSVAPRLMEPSLWQWTRQVRPMLQAGLPRPISQPRPVLSRPRISAVAIRSFLRLPETPS